ncbi:hypothetical protein K466DRAFT_30400 [Polyporus arcularius HHB13444]|uniref:Metallo-beta-lactamase domain-containing protein n=1 Tax=Polyporus arcularius HHB13444 TaxID=1314778 RepID=A0A5C3PIH4_9APHY|nr:hypothetical protein K466DRAFT_30400 [Polyporus arcularius HHB13444]
MSHDITVTFLGTTSGGGPSETRNCSSLVVDALGNGSLWMVDCAEGTVRQFINQPNLPGQSRAKIGRVSKIFITHMHGEYCCTGSSWRHLGDKWLVLLVGVMYAGNVEEVLSVSCPRSSRIRTPICSPLSFVRPTRIIRG